MASMDVSIIILFNLYYFKFQSIQYTYHLFTSFNNVFLNISNLYYLFQEVPSWVYSPVSPPMIINQDPYMNPFNGDQYSQPNHGTKDLTSSLKYTSRGAKLIRIEIYDAHQFENKEKSVCQCNAELCLQHVVKNIENDHVYTQVKDIILSLHTNNKLLDK